ncbi:protein sax-3-like isoform X2 [Rhipicephalus sanguineus]|uniref:protein sax-3-like isoform X2 n=1 Tax=Rhipicephalus sanguineus TaxID=34632 RepID=UPI0020C2EF8C|nr:protein sax-3-like isoform X2 [Rhipicephalus sanguineus]
MARQCDRRRWFLDLWITTCRIIAIFLLSVIVCTGDAANAASSHGGGGGRAPRITEQPVDVVVRKHEPVTLRCGADGDPPPRIAWFHDGRPVRNSATRMVLPEGQLFFLQVQHSRREQDTGLYWCTATNALGTVRSRNASVELAVLRDEFRQLPKSIHVAGGESATLECVPPRGHPEPTVTWFKDGVQVQPGTGRVRLLAQGALVIADVRPSDQGRYVCRAANMLGTRDSPAAQLSVHTKPYFVRVPEDVTSLAEESVEFQCKVNGDPKPTVTWRRQDGKMPVGRAYVQEDKSLHIKNVALADEGTYICESENIVGSVSASATLTVHSRPTFRLTPQNQKVGLNGVAKFDCLATGNPPPSVFWTREGNQVLMFPGKSHGRFSVSNEGTLTISGVRKEDRGYYVCSALSVVGSSMAKGHLEVTALADLPPPIIRLGPANQTLPLHTAAQLPCDATGTPKPTVQWLYNGAPLRIEERPRYTLLQSGTLQIQDLQMLDSGAYTCKASSESGETSWTASLTIESPHNPNVNFHRSPDPSTFPGPPSQPVPVNTTETSITLAWRRSEKVGASSLKGYTIEYYSSDLQSGWVLAAHRVLAEKYTIQALRPDSRYVFIVRAENSHGQGVPSPVSEPIRTLGMAPHFLPEFNLDEARAKLSACIVSLQDIRAVSSTAVKLNWKIQGMRDYVEGFYIRFRDMSGGSQKYNMVTVLNGGALSYVLNDLKKFTKYEFFLVPFYRSVEGPPSNSRSVQTMEDVPTAPPESVEVQVVNGTMATIFWSPPPPQHRNGRLRGYNVYVDGNSSNIHLNQSTNSTTNSLTLNNLKTGASYEARVVALTTVGGGPASSAVQFKMESPAASTSLSTPFQNIVTQSWFIALFGFLLLVAVTIFVLLLIRKRRLQHAKSLATVPVNKQEDISVYAPLNCGINAPDYAEVDAQSMTTFYKKDLPSIPEPYATTTLINPSLQKSLNGSAKDARSGSSAEEGSRKSEKAFDLELARASEDGITDRLLESDKLASPASDSGSYTTDEYGMPIKKCRQNFSRGGSSSKGPMMNWSELIPPPPEQPPSEAGSPTSTPACLRGTPPRNVQLKQKLQINGAQPVSNMRGAHGQPRVQTHFPRSTLNKSSNSLGNSHGDSYENVPPFFPKGPRSLLKPLQPQQSHQQQQQQQLFSNPFIDRGVQSSLPSLINEPRSSIPAAEPTGYRFGAAQGYIYEPENADSDVELMTRPRSIESSIAGDTDYAPSHAPSWASTTERSNSSCTSGRSSRASSYDDPVYNEVDFASAVARAAQNAGFQVNGSVISTTTPTPEQGAKRGVHERQHNQQNQKVTNLPQNASKTLTHQMRNTETHPQNQLFSLSLPSQRTLEDQRPDHDENNQPMQSNDGAPYKPPSFHIYHDPPHLVTPPGSGRKQWRAVSRDGEVSAQILSGHLYHGST